MHFVILVRCGIELISIIPTQIDIVREFEVIENRPKINELENRSQFPRISYHSVDTVLPQVASIYLNLTLSTFTFQIHYTLSAQIFVIAPGGAAIVLLILTYSLLRRRKIILLSHLCLHEVHRFQTKFTWRTQGIEILTVNKGRRKNRYNRYIKHHKMACRKNAYRGLAEMSEYMEKQNEEEARSQRAFDEEQRKIWTPPSLLERCCIPWLASGPHRMVRTGGNMAAVTSRGCSGCCSRDHPKITLDFGVSVY